MVKKEKREIAIKVNNDLYDSFKEYCRQNNIIPATAIISFMCEKAKEAKADNNSEINFDNKEGLKFVSINTHMRNTATYSLSYTKSEDERLSDIAKEILALRPDVIGIQEYAPAKGDGFIQNLERAGYTIYTPEGFDKEQCKKMWCVTILAVKKALDFKQSYIPGECNFRYITGVITYGNKSIGVMCVHVPSVDDENSVRQVNRKQEMFLTISRFMKEQRESYVLFGDINTDHDAVCGQNLSRIEKTMADCIEGQENTWENKRLDRIFCTKDLKESFSIYSKVCHDVVRKALTDHSVLVCEFIG